MFVILTGLVSCVVNDTVGGTSIPDSSIPDASIPAPPPTPQQLARQAFDRDVHPALVGKCVRCHTTAGEARGPAFLSPDVANAYDMLMANPTIIGDFTETGAKIYSFVQGGHFGPYLAPDQGKMLVWLGLELQARAAPTTSP